jgi:thiamine biosynthesis protein ThiS
MRLILDGQNKEAQHTGSIADLLKKLKLRREEVVVKLNGELAPETVSVEESDKVEIIRVVFGG